MNIINIAIADDHAMIREGIKQILEMEDDFKVIGMFENGKELLSAYDTEDFKADVLLLDLNMPIMDGITTLKHIKKKNIKSKIIVLTIHNQNEYLKRALNYKVDGYILKEAESIILKKAIRDVNLGEKVIHESLWPALREISKEENKQEEKELSKRELEVLRLISHGMFNKEIAYQLSISEKTVKNHVSNIFKKIKVSDRTQAAIYAIKNDLFNN